MFLTTTNLLNVQVLLPIIGTGIQQALSSYQQGNGCEKVLKKNGKTTSDLEIPFLPRYVDRLTPFTTLLSNDIITCVQFPTRWRHSNQQPNLYCGFVNFSVARQAHVNNDWLGKIRTFKTQSQPSKEPQQKPNLPLDFKSIKEMITGKPEDDVNGKINYLLRTYDLRQKDATILRLGLEEGQQMAKKNYKDTSKPSIMFYVGVLGLLLTGSYMMIKQLGFISYKKGFKLGTDKGVTSDIRFDDVQGIEDVKGELEDIVEYLQDPDRYTDFGAKLPAGVLLIGPPGTGKTLLAKAVAGEAGVPFFYAAGSEFDEMFVGVGASRVRKLFESARAEAPSIIFIDEIDACGSKRVNSSLQPFARQTINQLLQEMDGFNAKKPVVVIGATNTGKVLDKALTRAGRFDLKVNIMLPDIAGRKSILELYMNKLRHKTAPSVNLDRIASLSGGMSGADLNNIVNQAALRAVKLNRSAVEQEDLEFALDKARMGPELKSRVHTDKEIRNTALHEAGHALVAYYTPESHKIYKATIRQRGQALGHVALIPSREDENTMSKGKLFAQMDVAMGGRVAEELMHGVDNVNTGASSDIETATAIAYQLVCKFGMSEKLGLMTYHLEHLSQETKRNVEVEVQDILKKSYEKSKKVLTTHSFEHQLLAQALVRYETLTMDEIKLILESRDIDTVARARQREEIERMRRKLERSSGGRGFGELSTPVIDYHPPERASS